MRDLLDCFCCTSKSPVPAMSLPARWHLPREQYLAVVMNHTCSLAWMAAAFVVIVLPDHLVPLGSCVGLFACRKG